MVSFQVHVCFFAKQDVEEGYQMAGPVNIYSVQSLVCVCVCVCVHQ